MPSAGLQQLAAALMISLIHLLTPPMQKGTVIKPNGSASSFCRTNSLIIGLPPVRPPSIACNANAMQGQQKRGTGGVGANEKQEFLCGVW